MALPTEIRTDTLELILSVTKDVPERQLQDVTALDGKMMQLFSVGGVVIGLAGLSTITAATATSGLAGPALLFGLLCFAGLAIVSLLELTVRTYRRTPNGAEWWARSAWVDCDQVGMTPRGSVGAPTVLAHERDQMRVPLAAIRNAVNWVGRPFRVGAS